MGRILFALMLSTFPAQANDANWWTGTFVVEGMNALGCQNHEENDSRVTYGTETSEYWENSCSIERIEPLGGMDAVILEERCEGMDGDPVEFRRVLLMSRTHESHLRGKAGLYRYPYMANLERCSSRNNE